MAAFDVQVTTFSVISRATGSSRAAAPAGREGAHDVALGEDAEDGPELVGDDHGADVPLDKEPRRLCQGLSRIDAENLPAFVKRMRLTIMLLPPMLADAR